MIGGSRCLATRLASSVVALVGSIAISGAALAQPRPISDKDRQVARDMVKRAISRSEAGDHTGAIKIYLQAYALVPNALLLSNIGAEYQQDNKPEEALQYFCTYLEKDPAGTNAPYATAQARILQGQLGNKVTGSDVCGVHRSAPPGDDATSGTAPALASPAKFAPASRPVQPAPASTPQAPGGNATLRYIGIASGIGGAVALGIGAYDGYRARDISARLDTYAGPSRTAGWPPDIQNLQRSGQHYEDLQIRFLIAGGVLATAGVVLYIAGRPDAPDQRDRPAIGITPTSNGAAMFGRF